MHPHLTHSASSSATIEVHLKPRASRQCIVRSNGLSVDVAVNAPPVDGKANSALVELLADTLGVRKSSLSIIRGQTSRNKVVAVAGLSADVVAQRLARA
jgi:hypothetical protein